MNNSELWLASPQSVDAAFSVLLLIVIFFVALILNIWIDGGDDK